MNWEIIFNVMIGMFLYYTAMGVFRALLGYARKCLRDLDDDIERAEERTEEFIKGKKKDIKIVGFTPNDKEG